MIRTIQVVHVAGRLAPTCVASIETDAADLVGALTQTVEATRGVEGVAWTFHRRVKALAPELRDHIFCRDTARGDVLHAGPEGIFVIEGIGTYPRIGAIQEATHVTA
jgi:hypothetical protein